MSQACNNVIADEVVDRGVVADVIAVFLEVLGGSSSGSSYGDDGGSGSQSCSGSNESLLLRECKRRSSTTKLCIKPISQQFYWVQQRYVMMRMTAYKNMGNWATMTMTTTATTDVTTALYTAIATATTIATAATTTKTKKNENNSHSNYKKQNQQQYDATRHSIVAQQVLPQTKTQHRIANHKASERFI